MDGTELRNRLQALLDEEVGASFIDTKTAYDFLNEGAEEVARQTNILVGTQSITTVADQTNYSLNADYLALYLKDKNNQFFIKYNDGTTNHFIPEDVFSDITITDNTDSVLIPSRFTIVYDPSEDSTLTGATTSAGALNSDNGESVCNNSAAPFGNVSAGDTIHNTTDDTTGVVTEVTSTSALVTAMYPNDPHSAATEDQNWDSSDTYYVQTQGRYNLVLDPPPSTAGHTITLYYVQKPSPVYSHFNTFKFPRQLNLAVVKYAAWLYKYKDREPNFGDQWYVRADNEMRKGKRMTDRALNKQKIRVNMRARR